MSDPETYRRSAALLIARHLERICGHAATSAEGAICMAQANVVKHHLEKPDNNHP